MNASASASASARKIGANLWEVEPLFNFKKLDGHPDADGDQPHEKQGEDNNISHPVAPYACAFTPTLKTSTHLLKVLNQISNLEEQHSHNTVLIKSLKHDLDISRAQIKTLVEERKRDHQEIKELTHDRVQSTEDELLEVKSAFMREKKSRILLESLCDEFAKGIRDYEQKVRFLQLNCRGKDQIVGSDRLILHVSEAWLDERDFADKSSISDNLFREIEMFLEAKRKQSHDSGFEDCEENRLRGVLVEPSSQSVSSMADLGPGPSAQPVTVQGPEPWAGAGVKANTLMAKLVEARLESQFSKATRVRMGQLYK